MKTAALIGLVVLMAMGCASTGGTGLDGLIPGGGNDNPFGQIDQAVMDSVSKLTPEQREQIADMAAKAAESQAPGTGDIARKTTLIMIDQMAEKGLTGIPLGLMQGDIMDIVQAEIDKETAPPESRPLSASHIAPAPESPATGITGSGIGYVLEIDSVTVPIELTGRLKLFGGDVPPNQ